MDCTFVCGCTVVHSRHGVQGGGFCFLREVLPQYSKLSFVRTNRSFMHVHARLYLNNICGPTTIYLAPFRCFFVSLQASSVRCYIAA